MRRRDVIFTPPALAVATVAAGPPGLAQTPSTKLHRVGLFAAGNPRSSPQWIAFDARLRELGYVEGRNLVTTFRDGGGRREQMAAIAAELAKLDLDLLVAAGPEPLFAALRDAAVRLPIVMISVDFDPVADGYIASLARPGGRMTGVTFRQIEVSAKRVELLKQTLPGIGRIVVLWDAFSRDQLQAAVDTAAKLRLAVDAFELAERPYDFDRALQPQPSGLATGFVCSLSPELFRERHRVAQTAVARRIPAIFPLREFAEAGGLLSYGVSFPDQWRRAAEYADKVLRGNYPGDLPVEQPSRFELVINMRTAHALGISLDPTVLARADELIE